MYWECAIHIRGISILVIMHLMQLCCLNTRGPILHTSDDATELVVFLIDHFPQV